MFSSGSLEEGATTSTSTPSTSTAVVDSAGPSYLNMSISMGGGLTSIAEDAGGGTESRAPTSAPSPVPQSVVGGAGPASSPTPAAGATIPAFDSAVMGAMLQRSSSAPPVADNVAGWTEEHGPTPAGTSKSSLDPNSSDYYYYYYAPNNLNPRQPHSPPQGGAGAGAGAGAAGDDSQLQAPVALGGRMGLEQQDLGVPVHATRRSAPASPGITNARIEALEAFGDHKRFNGSNSNGGPQSTSPPTNIREVSPVFGSAGSQVQAGQTGGSAQPKRGMPAGYAPKGASVSAAGGADSRDRWGVMEDLEASLQGLGIGGEGARLQQQLPQHMSPTPTLAGGYMGQQGQQQQQPGVALAHQPGEALSQQLYGVDPRVVPNGRPMDARLAQQFNEQQRYDNRYMQARVDPRTGAGLYDARGDFGYSRADMAADARMGPQANGYYQPSPLGGAAGLGGGQRMSQHQHQPVYINPRDARYQQAYRMGSQGQPYEPVHHADMPHEMRGRRPINHGVAMGAAGRNLAYYPMDMRVPVRESVGDAYYTGRMVSDGHGRYDPHHTRSRMDDRDDMRGLGGMKTWKDGRDDHRDRDRDRGGGGRSQHRASGGHGGGRGMLLDEFRVSVGKGHNWELSDLRGHVVEFCRDQHGSRFIQQKLEVASDAEKAAFFDEVFAHAQSLMTDVFGNYVIQKLFDHGSPNQREDLASFLVGHAVQLSLQMYGCRVVQKALEFASIDTLIALVSEFNGQVMGCVQDQNGNHVIQKCIEVVSVKAKQEGSYLHRHIHFIIDAFKDQVEKLSTHAYGCRVIQRILEHCIDEQKNPILEEIRNGFGGLIQDQYGNYVIQHVLKHGRPADRKMLMDEVKRCLLAYSQHKFASNVVEKCLQYGTSEERKALLDHLIYGHADGQASLLQVMVCDPYANYVVQKIIDVADAEQRETIITEIKTHASQLKRFTFGKHIISRLEKISGKKM